MTLRSVLRKLRALTRQRALSRDIADELRAHLELEAASLRDEGLDEREARRAAGVAFGSFDGTAEACREIRGVPWLESAWAQLRDGLRTLRHAPGFAVAAVGVLGLGIGAATSAFSVADAVVFQPLPYADEARLFSVYESDSTGALRPPSMPAVRDWREQTSAFSSLAYVRGETLGLRGPEGTLLLLAAFVRGDLFSALAVQPALGRVFGNDEADRGEPVAVLGWHLWRDQFGGDPAVIGQTLSTEVGPLTVIGVLPQGARIPSYADLWVPQGALPASGRAAIERRDLHVDAQTVGRLSAGATVEQAVPELAAVSARAALIHPDARGWTDVTLRPVRTEILGAAPGRMLLLGGATLVLLLIACVNVAGLLIARSAARERELSVRAALGATRARLAGPLLAESLWLSAGGALLGFALARVTVQLLVARAPGALPRLEAAGVDIAAFGFAMAIALLTTVMFGVLPARAAARVAPMDALRSTRGAGTGRRQERLRGALVIIEVALAAILVVAATSLAGVLSRVSGTDLGFRVDGISAIRIMPPMPRYESAEAALALYDRLRDRVEQLPGVRRVALTNHLPLSGTSMPTDVRTSRVPAPEERPFAFYRAVSANWFDTLGVELVRGRALTEDEVNGRAPVAVVNERLARREWGDEDPLGKTITVHRVAQGRPDFGQPMTLTVVGLAADTRSYGPETPEPPFVYVPYTLSVWDNIFVVVEGTGSSPSLADDVRLAIQDVDPAIPVAGPGFVNRVRSLEEYAAGFFSARRLNLTLLGAFATIAVLLATVGLFGVISYLVIQRRREFGVRFAIGASRSAVIALVLRRSTRLVTAGLAIGFLSAFALVRLFGSQLPDLAAMNPGAFLLSALLFATTALLASALPALRACRVAPASILRDEG